MDDRKLVSLQSTDKVAETLLIPLYLRAKESQRTDAMMQDARAEALVERIAYDWSRIKLQAHDEVALILRVQEFDRQARDFMAHHPRAAVVHIGCGLDTRFERVDDGQVEWFDLDLPEVMRLRRSLMGSGTARCRQVACSVFDASWMDAVSALGHRPLLLLAEGVLPYFTETQVKGLVLAVKARFPGAELVFDAHKPFLIVMDNLQLALTKIKARLHWGLKHPRVLEGWGEGIKLLKEWYYFAEPHPRMEAWRWMDRVPLLGKATGIFHYCLGEGV